MQGSEAAETSEPGHPAAAVSSRVSSTQRPSDDGTGVQSSLAPTPEEYIGGFTQALDRIYRERGAPATVIGRQLRTTAATGLERAATAPSLTTAGHQRAQQRLASAVSSPAAASTSRATGPAQHVQVSATSLNSIGQLVPADGARSRPATYGGESTEGSSASNTLLPLVVVRCSSTSTAQPTVPLTSSWASLTSSSHSVTSSSSSVTSLSSLGAVRQSVVPSSVASTSRSCSTSRPATTAVNARVGAATVLQDSAPITEKQRRNRDAARRCRDKRLLQMRRMRQQLDALGPQNDTLTQNIRQLRQHVERLQGLIRLHVNDPSCRLSGDGRERGVETVVVESFSGLTSDQSD